MLCATITAFLVVPYFPLIMKQATLMQGRKTGHGVVEWKSMIQKGRNIPHDVYLK